METIRDLIIAVIHNIDKRHYMTASVFANSAYLYAFEEKGLKFLISNLNSVDTRIMYKDYYGARHYAKMVLNEIEALSIA